VPVPWWISIGRGSVARRITIVQYTYSYNIACANHKELGSAFHQHDLGLRM
jgi:hypothetical protein